MGIYARVRGANDVDIDLQWYIMCASVSVFSRHGMESMTSWTSSRLL